MIGSPVSMQLNGGGGFAALQAKLGDPLELHWEMMTLDDDLDFFVQRCVAEPGTVNVPVGKPGKSRGGGYGGGGYGGGGGRGGASCPGGDCQLSGGIPRGMVSPFSKNCLRITDRVLGIADIASVGNGPPNGPTCIGGDCQLQGGPPGGVPAGGSCVGGTCRLSGGPQGSLEQQLQQQQLLLIDKGYVPSHVLRERLSILPFVLSGAPLQRSVGS